MNSIDQLQDKLSEQFDNPNIEEVLIACQNYEVLGLGGRRVVLSIGQEQVAKLAWRQSGLVDNMIEARIWQEAGRELRQHLCPLLQLRSSGVEIQTLCLPVAYEALGKEAYQTMRLLASYGISDSASNLALLEKRIVCYDYNVISAERYKQLFA